MLRGLLGRLLGAGPGGDAPPRDAASASASALASPYLERGADESAAHHELRLDETSLVWDAWKRQQHEWLDGTRVYEPASGVPVLNKQPLSGKTVLVHGWPGLGDSLNFVRFVSHLKARGARVVCDVQPPAAGLLQRVRGVDAVIVDGAGAQALKPDFTLPTTTLLLHALLPALDEAARRGSAAPYLDASPAAVARWAPRLAQLPRPRIGLSWAGNPANRNDAIRSLSLTALAPLLAASGALFVSLQVGVAAQQAQAWGNRVLDLSAELRDLDDTAAVVAHLDLVISIDSTVAHLAGGMGKPLWLLRSAGADRRWDLVRDDRHWYAGLQVYGTEQPGEWDGVIARITADAARYAPHG